jgi:hypothetical protein
MPPGPPQGPPPGMGGPPPGAGAPPPYGPGWTQPEWIGPGGRPPRRRRRGVILGAIGAAFAIVLGSGAINAKLASEGMSGGLITRDTDDGLVVASNEDYAGMLGSGGDLGTSDGFETALPDGSDSTVAYYLDFDRLTDAMAQDESADEDDIESLEPMRAIGSSLTQVDGGQRWTTRLVFD